MGGGASTWGRGGGGSTAEDSSWERWRLKDLAKISPGAGGRAGRSTPAGEVQHLQTWRRRQEVHRVQELL